MKKVLLFDLETRSRVDLKAAGHRRYAADPSTSITVGAWMWRGRPASLSGAVFLPKLAHLGLETPFDFALALDEADEVVCHNAGFDVNVIRETLGVDIPPSKISCTMARAQRMSLPGGLDELAKTLGVPGKSPGGTLLVMKTCKPQRDGTFCEDEGVFRDLLGYCLQDVRAMAEVDARLPELPPSERIIWERTWRKNEAGLPIDVELARAVAARREEIELEVAKELRAATGGAVTAVTQRQRIGKWLETVGVPVRDLRKETVEETLECESLPFEAFDVLTSLKESGGMAPTKAQSLLDRQLGGFYKDHTRYFGARSGRGTSEGVNTFNFSRPSGKYDVDAVIGLMKTGARSGRIVLPEKEGDPLIEGNIGNAALSDVLRGMVCAPPGYRIVDADLSNIELRLALWFAGDEDRLKILGSGGDLYMYNAINLFGLPRGATKKTHRAERQNAKTVTLGGNYGLGKDRFYAVQRRIISGLTLEKSAAWIQGYRSDNPKLAGKNGLWRALDTAAREAFYRPDSIFEAAAGKLAFCYSVVNPWAPEDRLNIGGARVLWLRLPSGRAIPHYSPAIDRDSGEMTFMRAKLGRMLPQRAYGGAYLEIACFGAETSVLTFNGLKRIVDVAPDDLVWDGAEWVAHGGVVFRGIKEVICLDEVFVTSDHGILCSELSTNAQSTSIWKTAGELKSSPALLNQAFLTAQERLPWRPPQPRGLQTQWLGRLSGIVLGASPLKGLSRFDDATARASLLEELTLLRASIATAGKRIFLSRINHCLGGGNWRHALNAMGRILRRFKKRLAAMPPSALMTELGTAFCESLRGSCTDAIIPMTQVIATMGGEGLKCGPLGEWRSAAQEKENLAALRGRWKLSAKQRSRSVDSWNTSSPSPDTTTRVLNSTGSIMKKDTSPETYVLPQLPRISEIGGTCKISNSFAPTFDIVDCGPRKRFAIYSPRGNFLIAHNCQSAARDCLTAIEEQVEREILDVRVAMDVYDSVICVAPEDVAEERLKQILAIMRRPIPWAPGLPLDGEGYAAQKMAK